MVSLRWCTPKATHDDFRLLPLQRTLRNFMELYVWDKFSQTLWNCGCSYPQNCAAKFSFSGRTYSSPPTRFWTHPVGSSTSNRRRTCFAEDRLRQSLLLFTALYKCIYTYSTVTRDLGVLIYAQLTHSTSVPVSSPAAVSTNHGVSKK